MALKWLFDAAWYQHLKESLDKCWTKLGIFDPSWLQHCHSIQKQILWQCCHCCTQHWLNICQIHVLWVFYQIFTCFRTKQRKEQLSQEKAETILESAMLVNTPKLLKTCLILHWTRWKVYFQKPTQLRWLRVKFNKNFQISFCKILKTNSTVWKYMQRGFI